MLLSFLKDALYFLLFLLIFLFYKLVSDLRECTSVSSTYTTAHPDITEILLKLASSKKKKLLPPILYS